jgi:hypothetical protein
VTYRLVQLAAGAYDLERDGTVVASVVRHPERELWSAELIDERRPHPAPFTQVEHTFDSLAAVVAWLGPDLDFVPGRRPPRNRLS